MYVYMYIYTKDIHNEKTDIFENIFRLMNSSIHTLYNKKCYKNNIFQAISDNYRGKLVNKD